MHATPVRAQSDQYLDIRTGYIIAVAAIANGAGLERLPERLRHLTAQVDQFAAAGGWQHGHFGELDPFAMGTLLRIC